MVSSEPSSQNVLDHAAELAAAVAEALVQRGETLAVAESACGGLICHLLTNVAGSSRWFRSGIVAYSNSAKQELLGVDSALLASHGAVSRACALAMAAGVRARLSADWGLAETGIAGPQAGRRSAKPAGLAYVAVAGASAHAVLEVRSRLDERQANKLAFAA